MEGSDRRDRKPNARFSRIALTTLKEWLTSHQDDPYPTEDEKVDLERLTGLRVGQINTWFANARRRVKGHAETRSAPSCIIEPIDQLGDQESLAIDSEKRLFQCTFCTDTFKSKHDWTRHESSLHLSLKRCICCPLSPTIVDPVTELTTCAYFNAVEPTSEHIETHNHNECQARGPEAHTFFRKDHLRQHLRLVHKSPLLPHMDTWTLEAVFVNSRCGFCGQRFVIWNERNDHIAAHFKDGFQMHQWRGVGD